jgi:hypothetical protein
MPRSEDVYVYSHDWWYTDDSTEEARVKITLDESKLSRLVSRAKSNPSGAAQMGPFKAKVTERRPRTPSE